jgi:hypothetical protein
MKDDPREVDWAEKRINELKNRMRDIEYRLREMGIGVASLSEQGNTDRASVNDLRATVSGLSATVDRLIDRLDAYGIPEASFLDRRDANEAEGTVIGRGVKPIEGRCAAHSIRGCRTWPCGGVAPSTEYAGGYAKGEANAHLTITSDVLQAAEKRVREHLAGDFSPAMVNAVVKAIWGSEAKNPALTGLPSYAAWKRAKGKCCDE